MNNNKKINNSIPNTPILLRLVVLCWFVLLAFIFYITIIDPLIGYPYHNWSKDTRPPSKNSVILPDEEPGQYDNLPDW